MLYLLVYLTFIHRECQLQSLAIEGTLIEMDMVGGNWRRIRASHSDQLTHALADNGAGKPSHVTERLLMDKTSPALAS